MNIATALEFARAHRNGVLVTQKRDGRPQLSNIIYAVAAAPDDDAADELVALYRAMAGEHADWDDYRQAMVRDQRLVARLTPTHAYGMLPAG